MSPLFATTLDDFGFSGKPDSSILNIWQGRSQTRLLSLFPANQNNNRVLVSKLLQYASGLMFQDFEGLDLCVGI